VLIDGNLPHGITRLSAPKGLTGSRAELERFSLIVFSTFKRADSMLKHGNYSLITLPCGRRGGGMLSCTRKCNYLHS
jgi:hypothetical protein